MMVNYLAVYTESKNDSPGFSIWDTRQQALDAKVPKGMVLWDVIEIKDDATFGAETFEAPKTMTPTQAKKKFIALLKPYWIREIKAEIKLIDPPRDSMEKEDKKIFEEWLKIAKSGKIEQDPNTGDTAVRERAPMSFYLLQCDWSESMWEDIVVRPRGCPKSIKKQLKALLPAIKGGVAKPKPKARKTTRKKKTGRKAPTLSATKRKIGTRMRGNDGKMWQVKKSGKSQRWMAGAEGVVYTGNYQTNDDYNPYKYVNQAPFGAEETEPMNMKGAVGMFIAIVGILLWKA